MLRARPVRFWPPLGAGAVAACALALAACGSSSPSSSSSSSSSTTTGGSTASPSATTAADTALGRQELLAASAFPSGWKSQGSGSGDTQASFFGGLSASDVSQLTACLGIGSADVDTTPAEATDPEYDNPNSNATVAESIEVYPSAGEATADVTAATNPKTPQCLAELAGPKIKQGLPSGATVGQLEVKELTVPTVGQHRGGVELSLPFTYQGVSGTEYVDNYLVQAGRSEAVVQFTNTGGPVAASVVDPLLQAAAGRLQG